MKRFYVLIIILIVIIIPGLILYVGYADLKKERKYSEEVLAKNFDILADVNVLLMNEMMSRYALDSCRVSKYYFVAKDFTDSYEYLTSEIEKSINTNALMGKLKDTLLGYIRLKGIEKYEKKEVGFKTIFKSDIRIENEYSYLLESIQTIDKKALSEIEKHNIKNALANFNSNILGLILRVVGNPPDYWGRREIFMNYKMKAEYDTYYIGNATIATNHHHSRGFVVISRDYDSISQKYIGIIDTVKIEDYGPVKIKIDSDSIKEGENSLMLTYYWPNIRCRDKYDYVLLRKKFKFYKTE